MLLYFSHEIYFVLLTFYLRLVNYCHQRNLAHCDLKPENILLDGEDLNDLKIIDFGLAQQLEDENKMLTAMEGSYYYVSPQVRSSSVKVRKVQFYDLYP